MDTPLFQLLIKAQAATQQDRAALVALSTRLLAYSALAQQGGLLAICNRLEEETDAQLRTLLRFVVDGCVASYLEDAVLLYCSRCAGQPASVLRLMAIRTGVLFFHAGTGPRAIHGHLDILLGEGYLGPFKEVPRGIDPFAFYGLA